MMTTRYCRPLLRTASLSIFVAGWAALLFSAVSASGEDLVAEEGLATSTFHSPNSEPRPYLRLVKGDRASYLFCGQGRLKVLSRAILPEGVDAARYILDVKLDGAAPSWELGYRATVKAETRFDLRFRAGTLKRSTTHVARGCHTVAISLARSTVSAVGVRLVFDEESATKRAWRDVGLTSPSRPIHVEVGEARTQYELLDPGQSAELTVEGPVWVRILTRPVALDEPVSHSLVVAQSGQAIRSYELAYSASRRARLAKYPNLRIGRAKEAVFAVGPGRQRLILRSGPEVGIALRAQIAESGSIGRLSGETEASWTSRVQLASYYDSNILRYSDKFIQRFDEGRDPGRFRVESLDDTVQRVDLDVGRVYSGVGARRARLNVGIAHRSYFRNSIKDWTSGQISWDQDLGQGRRITLSFQATTDFYVRHLRDSDLVGGRSDDPFQAFEFERNQARVSFSQELGASWNARYGLSSAQFRHSQAFREFDSENLSANVRMDQQASRLIRFSYGLEFTDSQARGYDEEGETLETSDDTDPTYRQLDLMLAARFRIPGKRRQVFFFQAELGRRDYTTSKAPTLAPLHSGREDDFTRLYGSWQIDLSKRYRLTVFGQERKRSSSAPIDLDIGVEKDFDQYEVGVRMTARFGN